MKKNEFQRNIYASKRAKTYMMLEIFIVIHAIFYVFPNEHYPKHSMREGKKCTEVEGYNNEGSVNKL